MRLNSFHLKIIGLLLMIVDHIHQFIPGMPVWMNWIGRIVAPIFFYLVVEGFYKTSSRKRYISRMLTAAVGMAIGSQLLMSLFPNPEYPIFNNIFLSLAFALLQLTALEWTKTSGRTELGGIFVLLSSIGGLMTEASLLGVASVFIFYAFRDQKHSLIAAYTLTILTINIGLDLTVLPWVEVFTWDNLLYVNYQWMMCGAAILFALYNGERGYQARWSKYMFYVIYPVHIWLLYGISYALLS
ncbi:conjugal transfer protein TraX [Paenibacillus sp. ACRRX]|uniref:TraX family protein n=1 Tax=unclassified Paenibacillus TaxID=185978 RepID=UPI001EF5B7FF|nr:MULTISPECIES: TraX family protein [unclassified Paenibacillus]MCG7409077.1 conjugal transfer protein TraX [Paenibacillus sp. ACRRX]MDK8181923.1 TraX family protein [Paenibacillus sp. UMB4589-SE434]